MKRNINFCIRTTWRIGTCISGRFLRWSLIRLFSSGFCTEQWINVPPKRRNIYPLHGAVTQNKTVIWVNCIFSFPRAHARRYLVNQYRSNWEFHSQILLHCDGERRWRLMVIELTKFILVNFRTQHRSCISGIFAGVSFIFSRGIFRQ